MVEAPYHELLNWMGAFVSNLCIRRSQIEFSKFSTIAEEGYAAKAFCQFDFYYANCSQIPAFRMNHVMPLQYTTGSFYFD